MTELETALLRDPDDLASLLVYADLLQSRADPRGEWISLQHAAMTRPHEPALRAACDAFLRAHEPALLGPLAAPVALARARGSGWGVAIEWRLGFFHSVTVGLPAAASSRAAADQMQAVIDHPAARRLEQLTLGSRDHWAAWIKHRANLDVLRAARPERGEPSALPMLRKLEIRADLDSEVELGELWSRYPSLEHAELSADQLGLGRIAAPSLRSLDIETTLGERHIAALVAAECPSLARLILRGAAPVFPLLDLIGRPWPELAILGLPGAISADLICARLAGSSWARQLRALDLRGTDVTVGGTALLVREVFPLLSWVGTPGLDAGELDRLRAFCATVAVS